MIFMRHRYKILEVKKNSNFWPIVFFKFMVPQGNRMYRQMIDSSSYKDFGRRDIFPPTEDGAETAG